MSLTLAITCSDGIVIAADGRSTDSDTGDERSDASKIFALTQNSAVLVAGSGLVDEFDKYMDNLISSVRAIEHARVSDIAEDVKNIVNRRDWAEYKDEQKKSYLDLLVVGYDDMIPGIHIILDNRDHKTHVVAHAHGSWDDKMRYLEAHLNADPSKNTLKQAKKVAIEMLVKAEAANPQEIGEPFSMWHVMQSGIRKLASSEVAKLRNRYARNLNG